MPLVPRRTNTEADLTPLQTPEASQASAAAFGAVRAEQSARVGERLQDAGAVVADIGRRMQETDDAAAVLSADAELKNYTLQQQAAAQETRGKDALGLTQKMAAEWDKYVSEVEAKLANDRQKALYRQRVANTRAQHVASLSRHEATQRTEYIKETVAANVQASIDLVAANPYDMRLSVRERSNIVSQIEYLGQHLGWDRARVDELISKQLTDLHKNVIQQLAVKDPAAAEGYYRAHESEIRGSERAEIGAFAESATARARGEEAADEVWLKHGPKSDRDPIELDKMEDVVRKKFGPTQKAAMDEAIKSLRDRASAAKAGRAERANALEASVNKLILDGASSGSVRRSPEFIRLSQDSPEAARKVDEFLQRRDEHRALMAERALAREYQRENLRQQMLTQETAAVLFVYSDPDVLLRLSRDQIIGMLPDIGTQNTRTLLDRYDALTKSVDNAREAKLDYQMFRSMLQRFGLEDKYINAKPRTANYNAVLTLQGEVNRAIEAERVATRRPVTQERKLEIMEQILSEEVRRDRPWYLGGDVNERFALQTPEQRRRSSIVVRDPVDGAPREVRFGDIPEAEMAKIEDALRRNGHPVTAENIARLWLMRSPSITSGVPR